MNTMNRLVKIVACLLFSMNASAQNKCDWGIEGGPNISTFIVKNNKGSYPGNHVFGSAGFTFQYNFTKLLALRTGFSYQQKGYQFHDVFFDNPAGNGYVKGDLISRFDYISLPLLVKASFGKKVQFFVNAGPYIAYLLQKREREKIAGDDPVQTYRKVSGLQHGDFGVAGGIGITIPVKAHWLISLEARDYLGLLNLNTVNYTNEKDPPKSYTHTVDFRIGLAYRMGSGE